MKQSEAVYNATHKVFAENGIQFEDGDNVKDVITTELRKQVIGIVTAGIESGDVDFSDSAKAKYDSTEKISGYVAGMVSNWFRKDPKLNGGETYQPKNPGSRAGSQDDQVKALRALLKSGTLDEDGTAMAETALEQRLSEIKAAKTKVEIDVDALPESLRHLVQH